MKSMMAQKVKNGWYVQIVQTHHLFSESDVRKFARQQGLKVNEALKQEDKIFAD